MKFTCPNCHTKTITLTQKLLLNSAGPTECSECKAKLTSPIFWNLISFSPILVYLFFSHTYKPSSEVEALFFACALMTSVLVHIFVSPIFVNTKPSISHNSQ
jgi:hypothetical protein